MATTGAIRGRRSTFTVQAVARGPGSVRVGVLWGYPFSLVRQLTLIFIGVLGLCAAGAWVFSTPGDPVEVLLHIVPVAVAILLSLYVAELVGVTERPLPPLTVESLFWSIASCCIVMAVGYAVVPTYAPSTTLVCAAPVAAALGVYAMRKWVDARGAAAEEVPAALFAGGQAQAIRGLAECAQIPGISIRGVILPQGTPAGTSLAGLPIRDARAGLAWFRESGIQLFLAGEASSEQLRAVLSPYVGAGCIVERPEELAAKMQGRIHLSSACDDVTLLSSMTEQASRFPAQRLFDVVLALCATPPSLAIGILVALAIRLTSRGPVLYRQERVGRWGRPFTMLKFRTMCADAEKMTGPVWATEDDPRITPLGQFLRRIRADELPQLWNVLVGHMSLVGPRPERPHFVEELRRKLPLYEARHSVRPGVTGWAQIRYQYAATEADAGNKLAYELFYVRHRSFTFYFAVLLETVKVVLFRRGSR